jgi:hypothetical protein
MRRPMNKVAVVLIVLSIIGTIASMNLAMYWNARNEPTSFSTVSSGGGIALTGHPVEYEVFVIHTDPDRGPYSFRWYFSDGTIEDGSNATVHTFSIPGIYHTSAVISGRYGWNHTLEFSETIILAPDALDVTVLEMGQCNWREVNEGDLYLNFTLWSSASFPIALYARSFSLYDHASDSISPQSDQMAYRVTVPAGGNLTLTVLYPWGHVVPDRLSCSSLFEWSIGPG